MPHLTDCSYYDMRDGIQVSNVQSHQENPEYHFHQAQAQQVKQYLTLSSEHAGQAHPGPHPYARQPLGAVPVMRNGHMSQEGDGSPVIRLSLETSNHDSEFQMDEVIDDLVSLESDFNDGGLDCMESNILMQSNVSLNGGMLDMYDIMPENAKERQKKNNHNQIEKRRRYNINYRIKELGTLIPKCDDPDMRWNKGTILKATVEYIKWLQTEQQHTGELERRQKKLEQTNRRLASMATTLESLELSTRLLKQEQGPQPPQQPPLYPEELNCGGEYLPRTPIATGEPLGPSGGAAGGMRSSSSGLGVTAGKPGDGLTTFLDPMSHFTDFLSATLKEEPRLEEMLMDDTLSPFGTDPLLSAVSPYVSTGSSRRSSFSTDDDNL